MNAIDDYNEITYHFLNVIYGHLSNNFWNRWGLQRKKPIEIKPIISSDVELLKRVFLFVESVEFSCSLLGCSIDRIYSRFPKTNPTLIDEAIDNLLSIGRIFESQSIPKKSQASKPIVCEIDMSKEGAEFKQYKRYFKSVTDTLSTSKFNILAP